jgi:Zn-dependent protease with chaperone function
MKPSTRPYLIRRGDLNPGWVPLYAGTWALMAFCGFVRAVAVVPALLILNLFAGPMLGWHLPVDPLAMAIGYGPLFISLATLVLPLGAWWFEQSQGGRRPSEREQAVFDAAFGELQRFDPKLRPPRRWFVIDKDEANACAYADTLMVTRGMLDSAAFPAVLAHELGHLNSSDARVTAAVYRLTTPPREPVGFPFRLITYVASGRAAMALTRTPWAIYWRHRERIADEYAARLGQGSTLADYLDVHALDGDLPTPFKFLSSDSHPWTEHRIDDLEAP